jgi:hypothetical protein
MYFDWNFNPLNLKIWKVVNDEKDSHVLLHVGDIKSRTNSTGNRKFFSGIQTCFLRNWFKIPDCFDIWGYESEILNQFLGKQVWIPEENFRFPVGNESKLPVTPMAENVINFRPKFGVQIRTLLNDKFALNLGGLKLVEFFSLRSDG